VPLVWSHYVWPLSSCFHRKFGRVKPKNLLTKLRSFSTPKYSVPHFCHDFAFHLLFYYSLLTHRVRLEILTAVNTNKLTVNVLLWLPSTHFVAQVHHTFPFTACFSLMGPSSGTLGFYNRLFPFRNSPHTGQCLHIGSALYVWSFYALFVKYIAYGISKKLKY
jgi:hypothetical protein